MATDLQVPELGESISEVQIARWLKSPGEYVEQDEPVVEIDSDKATLEVPAPVAGVLAEVLVGAGENARVGGVIARIDESAPAPAPAAPAGPPASTKKAAPRADENGAPKKQRVMPAAKRALAERGIEPGAVKATGRGGRILKEDVLQHREEEPASAPPNPSFAGIVTGAQRREEARPMTPMRRRIAERLVQAQQTAALLTTFNEVDMSAAIALRKTHQEAFTAKHGVKLGFMSFFVKAAVAALQEFPGVNAQIRDDQIVEFNYCDIGIAISSGKGLVVPVLRNAELMRFADIERAIADFGERARENKITLDELQGGTFTITNGGVFGSLLSTPIVNPPQTAVLGMHAIQDRPVAADGAVVIRPMMYVALTYDHRMVDGREAVTFLKRIKECVENPGRLLLDL
ncbi:MAG TPA: 2-oxoglutarate dehydrogenase complex dihydrolipoyllysine-residue succinyltransferase [Candidatus Hydrogenedentes bacterium]|jgi:2-oxoglutarate dehydrogenase E2 component (dihydrolipoamide succinyltransferase)|nr:2-oxoglutarate dehydrogenase complex dihydrolipoyllysine-residue succinyltransferase [FCB group bacterium]OQA40121.1 MAG: Dihydrolipoyllysine-residue succinyltransferase component of 2-oxoglutarate dehydrogenase complex [Chloroflexi bacterium ADurb.Bin325]HNV20125.1 2-oxoglutarate dehydrogenase complex dihydrolipoyllysine-residue succinyltransferase [Candidatus Hydrogenedentota bacterium]HPX38850.1 2-oxoglutarate dehydrogenase complex dihydrolipoyllysine-residue succinyltransferase [Candidatu